MRTDAKLPLLLFLPFGVLALFYILLPLFSILWKSFFDNGGAFIGMSNYGEIFSNPYYFMGIANSLKVSFFSALIGLILDFMGAYVIYNNEGVLKKVFLNVLNMTSNFQGIQLAFAFMIILGNSGVLVLLGQTLGWSFLADFDLYGTNGLLLTFIHFQIPLGTLLLYPAFAMIQDEYKEAAQLLKTGTLRFWLYIGIPILSPVLFGIFSILFANALAAYATPYALLGNNYPLMPIQISSMFTGDIVQQPGTGSALSVIMILIMLLVNGLGLLAGSNREGREVREEKQ